MESTKKVLYSTTGQKPSVFTISPSLSTPMDLRWGVPSLLEMRDPDTWYGEYYDIETHTILHTSTKNAYDGMPVYVAAEKQVYILIGSETKKVDYDKDIPHMYTDELPYGWKVLGGNVGEYVSKVQIKDLDEITDIKTGNIKDLGYTGDVLIGALFTGEKINPKYVNSDNILTVLYNSPKTLNDADCFIKIDGSSIIEDSETTPSSSKLYILGTTNTIDGVIYKAGTQFVWNGSNFVRVFNSSGSTSTSGLGYWKTLYLVKVEETANALTLSTQDDSIVLNGTINITNYDDEEYSNINILINDLVIATIDLSTDGISYKFDNVVLTTSEPYNLRVYQDSTIISQTLLVD